MSELRFCAVAVEGRRRLCVVAPDGPRALDGVADLTTLIESHPDAVSLEELLERCSVADEPLVAAMDVDGQLVDPVRPPEVWAAGVTYRRSRDARYDESSREKDAYSRVYEADRPELFLKATGWRVGGPRDPVGLRSDSRWQVPEAELGVLLGAEGRILGYLLANDQTSRDIEAANTLYIPQAKIFAGSCTLGPVVASTTAVALGELTIAVRVERDGVPIYEDALGLDQLRRDPEELVAYLCRDNPIRPGTILLTGTGMVPPDDFSLEQGDVVEISADGLGTLRNACRPAEALIG